MQDLALEVDDRADDALHEQVARELRAFNAGFLGAYDRRPLRVLARDGEGLTGALLGDTARGLLQVDLFWVAQRRRRQGLGTDLLRGAEEEARRRGCSLAWLRTYDFQARPFYERHGYAVFGELDGLPNGHRSYLLKKRLGEAHA
jgi:GNAT superfamily N-acetyltransferase